MHPGVLAPETRSSNRRHAKVNMEPAERIVQDFTGRGWTVIGSLPAALWGRDIFYESVISNRARTTTTPRWGNSGSFIRTLDSVKCPDLRRIELCQWEKGPGVESMARMTLREGGKTRVGCDRLFREPGGIRAGDHTENLNPNRSNLYRSDQSPAFVFGFDDVCLPHRSSLVYISALTHREESFARCDS